MWRVCDDLWDRWETSRRTSRASRAGRRTPPRRLARRRHAAARAHRHPRRAGRGPRTDRLTPAEQRTLMTLWVMARSPLMIGGGPALDRPDDDRAVHQRRGPADPPPVRRATASCCARATSWCGPRRRPTRAGPPSSTPTGTVREVHLRHALALGFGPSPAAVTDVWSGAAVAVEPIAAQSDDARSVAPGKLGRARAPSTARLRRC